MRSSRDRPANVREHNAREKEEWCWTAVNVPDNDESTVRLMAVDKGERPSGSGLLLKSGLERLKEGVPMKGKGLMVLLLLAAAVALCAGSGFSEQTFPDASKDPKVTLRWGCTAPSEDLASEAMRRVTKLVEERTGGSLKINFFPASQLGTAMTQMEMVINGNIDMFTEGAHYMADWGVPDSAVTSFMGQCPSKDIFAKFVQSDFYKAWEDEFLRTAGVRTLASNWIRPPAELVSKVPLYRFEDFKNLKVRSIPSEYSLATFKAMGMNPTAVAYDEVYLALQQGIINAAVATFDTIYTMNFYQVAKYVLKLDLSYVNFAIWMNERKFQSLSPAQREILLKTCQEVGVWYSQAVDQQLKSYIDKMAASGVTVIEYPQEELAKFAAAARKAAYDFEKAGKWSKGVFDKYLAVLQQLAK
ncbi:MAG: TRAP transporter substrate-binding protein [Firmicutes bacterium]|nr:TRAP transporter substrate-binding protein [Bacillota bacterium]MDH7495693.1 TRAP transporter substrate-binding protein [Bacillota bacterium]